MTATTPAIDVGGAYSSILHTSHLLPLPPKTPYGNLFLKWAKIISRLVRLNHQIAGAYSSHALALTNTQPTYPSPLEELTDGLEEIVYWLRKTVDELIALSYLCETHSASGTFVKKIDVDDIGSLLTAKKSTLPTKFEAHRKFLTQLNDISNAYKHSFINSDMNVIGRDEPVLFALRSPHNAQGKEKFISVPLGEVVRGADAFFQTAKSYLSTWVTGDTTIT